MTNRFLTTTLCAAAFALAACPGATDTSLGPQIELTEAQTADMLEAFDAIGSAGDDFRVISAMMRANLVAASRGVAFVTQAVDETSSCPVSGTTHVAGSLTYEGTSGSSSVTQTYNDCVAASLSGTRWTFNDAVNIQISGGFNEALEESVTTGTILGTLSVSSSQGSGSCTIDVSINEIDNSQGYTFVISGTVCGQPYSETISENY